MRTFLVNFCALALACAVFRDKGIYFQSYWDIFWVSITLSILNIFIKPILSSFLLPIGILTLGLTSFLLNIGLLSLAFYFVDTIQLQNGWIVVWIAFISAIVKSILG